MAGFRQGDKIVITTSAGRAGMAGVRQGAKIVITTVPREVCFSACETGVVSCDGEMTDIHGNRLTPGQLAEVAAVYNAWRAGNLEDCTIRGSQSLASLMERSWH